MHKLIRTLGFATLAIALTGCHLVYVPDVQQGNLLDKKNVTQLKPGMTKRQVVVLLGTPSVATPFDQERWDYVSSFSHRGEKMNVRTLTLYFNNDVLVRTEGDFFPEDTKQLLKDSQKYHTGYPVNETKGDKSTSPDDTKNDGGIFGGGNNSSGNNTGTGSGGH